MAERNGRCKEVYDTCPQHIGFLSGFAVSLEFDELKCTRFRLHTSPSDTAYAGGRPGPVDPP